MDWWIWIVLGFGLLIIELFIPSGFFLFMVGLAGISVGTLDFFGIAGPVWFQWVLCAVLTIGYSLFIRKPLMERLHTGKVAGGSGPVGDEIVLSEDIPAGGTGQGQLRGSNWQIKNSKSVLAQKGSRHTVVQVDGITLII